MCENITVSGQYECSSADLKYFHVSNLKTPLGHCKNSLLRSSDVILIHFENNSSVLTNQPVTIISSEMQQSQ